MTIEPREHLRPIYRTTERHEGRAFVLPFGESQKTIVRERQPIASFCAFPFVDNVEADLPLAPDQLSHRVFSR